MTAAQSTLTAFQWKPQPEAAAWITKLLDDVLAKSPFVARLSQRLRDETGTRLRDWIDHLRLPGSALDPTRLAAVGYGPAEEPGLWRISSGMFPPIAVSGSMSTQLVLHVESVADFLLAVGRAGEVTIEGEPGAPRRRARIESENGVELWAIERHGDPAILSHLGRGPDARALLAHAEALRLRPRRFPDDADGFRQARQRIAAAADDLGMPRACSLFFAGERDYWQSRNRAARIQKLRQDALGLGWGNHDHHTYRSSREHFASLIAVLEFLGFHCRERFYAGREAGWGAQVLENPTAGVVIFADVDLSPEEVAGDFAHDPLPPRDELGTVGLWCRLHGEAFLQAGMHHLECQFDFDAAREQLKAFGIESMKPFTDLPYLRQAFTKGEIWPVRPERVAPLQRAGLITGDQAAMFLDRGAVGSHLEILQRDDGYKGFNQTGINEIIRDTDPRQLMSSTADAPGRPARGA